MFTRFRAAVSLVTLASVVAAGAGCAAPAHEAEEEEVAVAADQALAPALAIPVVAVAAEKVVGFVLVATAIVIGGVRINTFVQQQNAARVTPELRSTIDRENDFFQRRYSSPIFASKAVTPDRWVKAFGYPASMLNASRSLYRTARDDDHRNKGGCVIATVDGENGVQYSGGAPYTSEHDIVAAQFVAGARAYFRCGIGSPDVIEAWQDFLPDTELPSVGAETFIDHSIKTAVMLNEVRKACRNPKFKVTLDKSKCR